MLGTIIYVCIIECTRVYEQMTCIFIMFCNVLLKHSKGIITITTNTINFFTWLSFEDVVCNHSAIQTAFSEKLRFQV